MSNEITRFNHVTDWGMERDADGDYVLHSDHKAEVARLRAEVEKVRGYEVAPLQAKVAELRAELQNAAKAALDATALACEKEREADVERADAERYRVIRRKVAIVGGEGKSEFRIINLDPRYVAPKASIELDAAIDAAMGEGK